MNRIFTINFCAKRRSPAIHFAYCNRNDMQVATRSELEVIRLKVAGSQKLVTLNFQPSTKNAARNPLGK
jgi:hypothetical protein